MFSFFFDLHIGGPFEKFVDSPYYTKSELCRGAVTVSFSKYLPWQAMHFVTTFHPENVLQIVCRKLQDDSGTGGFELLIWLEKPRNRMGRDLDCMADVLMGFHRPR
jgi:hypothetical protein